MLLKINSTNFPELIKSPLPIAVVFGAPWCGPCRRLEPALEKLSQQYSGRVLIGEVDVDQNESLAGEFGIRGIPSALFYQDGRLVASCIIGVGGYPVLKAAIDEIIPPATGDTTQHAAETEYAEALTHAQAVYDAAVAEVQAEWRTVVSAEEAVKTAAISQANGDEEKIQAANQAYELSVKPITQRVFAVRRPAEAAFISAVKTAAQDFLKRS